MSQTSPFEDFIDDLQREADAIDDEIGSSHGPLDPTSQSSVQTRLPIFRTTAESAAAELKYAGAPDTANLPSNASQCVLDIHQSIQIGSDAQNSDKVRGAALLRIAHVCAEDGLLENFVLHGP